MAAAHGVYLRGGGWTATASSKEQSLWSSRTRSKCLFERRRQTLAVKARAAAPDFEFGARDPFPEEIASNFAENVQGFSDTEHVILVPQSPALGLAERSCVLSLPPGTTPFSLDEAKALHRKIVGWRFLDEQSGLRLQCEWQLKDREAGLELQRRILTVAEAEGKTLELKFDEQTYVFRAEIWTEAIGGLCENDFILAAKIDEVKTTDLIKKARFWA